MEISTHYYGHHSRLLLRAIVFMFLILSCFGVSESLAQTQTFTVNFKDQKVVNVITYLQNNSSYNFTYSSANLSALTKRVTSNFNKATLSQILNKVFENTPYTYQITGRNVVIKAKSVQKQSSLRGHIVSTKGDPLVGVAVVVEGTTAGTATDVKGNFTLTVPSQTGTVSISALGYKPQKLAYDTDKQLSVRMSEAAERVDEVTVVAYGERKKREVVGAISSVKADDIKELPAASFETLMQGRMAGVEVNNVSGAPGGGGSIVAIRGYNSLFVGDGRDYGEPLYVIDGVPMHSFTSPVTGTNTIAEIDPSTIESVDVLKDAASAALYGSRAGNGVILITTKRGKDGKSKFSANVSTAYSILPETPIQTGGKMERDFFFERSRNFRAAKYSFALGRYVYPTNYEEGSRGAGMAQYDEWWSVARDGRGSVNMILQDSTNYFTNNSTDWFKYAFRTGKILNANIQASGGNDKLTYMLGGGYYNESGIMHGSDFQRINVLLNMGAKPVKRLSVDARFYVAYTDRSRGAGTNGLATGSKIESLTIDPRFTSSLLPAGGAVEDMLLKELNSTQEINETYRMMSSVMLKYEIIKGLSLSTMASLDMSMGVRNYFRPSTLSASSMNLSIGEIDRYSRVLNENIATYNHSFNDTHNIDLIAGQSIQLDNEYYNMSRGMGGPSDQIHYIRPGLPNVTYQYGAPVYLKHTITDKSKKVLISYFGRISYNYKKKYLSEFTLRRDGSSVFGKNNQWGYFPSVAVGWAFSEESFTQGLWWVDFGKVRASWGRSGQQFGQPYLAHGVMIGQGSILGNQGVFSDTDGGMLNPNLTWELTDQYDFGIDVDLFNYRVKVKADYYYKDTKGLLFEVALPSNHMYHKSQWQNAMNVSNEGVELELDVDIFRETAVTWRTKFNISRNWNKFKSSYNSRDVGRFVLGRPVSGIFLYKDDGCYDSQEEIPYKWSVEGNGMSLYPRNCGLYPYGVGMKQIIDVSNNGTIGDEDKVYAGNALPLAFGGWANEVKWNNFDLNFLFSFSIGRQIYKTYNYTHLNPTGGQSGPIFIDLKNEKFWEKPGDVSKYGQNALTSPDAQLTSGAFLSNLEKVNFAKLKQITLGYTLPGTYARVIGLSSIRAFITAENLFYISNYSGTDPEVVDISVGEDAFGNYPLARKFSLGLTVNF